VDGLLWKVGSESTDVHFQIGYAAARYVETPAYASLCEYLAADEGECSMYVCFDAPNMGKSVLVRQAVKHSGDILLQTRGDTYCLMDAKDQMFAWQKAQYDEYGGMIDPASARIMGVRMRKQTRNSSRHSLGLTEPRTGHVSGGPTSCKTGCSVCRT
jgi:hypothetical protein